jgi:sugar O-acyltransferase (sialic acid O-acetyltransferase NeuD family)
LKDNRIGFVANYKQLWPDDSQTTYAGVMEFLKVVIVGAGGSGRETYWVLRDFIAQSKSPIEFQGFVALDTPEPGLLDRLDAEFLGDPRNLVNRLPNASTWSYALGIGSAKYRRHMDEVLSHQGLKPLSLMHPMVQIGPDVNIGSGAVVCANTVITTNVRIGIAAQLNIGCVVGHDARIGDYVTMAQGVNIAGNVTIGNDATIFTGAIVLPGVNIGEGSTIGAGAVVVKDVAPHSTVVGVPAKPLG